MTSSPAEDDADSHLATPATPSYDQTMALLATVMETYCWPAFKAILYDAEKLKAWLKEKMQPESDRDLDPEDPVAVELSELTAETEHEAMMFLKELTAEERAKLKAGYRAVWGKDGASTLPF